jgi:hypothetical protein
MFDGLRIGPRARRTKFTKIPSRTLGTVTHPEAGFKSKSVDFYAAHIQPHSQMLPQGTIEINV